MADLTFVFLNFDVSSIESAYRTGRDAINLQSERARVSIDQHLAAVAAGTAEAELYDDDSGQTLDVTEHHYHALNMTYEMLNLHCQAFALMLHHVWEKHVCLTKGYEKYQAHKAYGELKKDGWPIQIEQLEKLRMVANCVKHDSGELYGTHPHMFADDLIPANDGKKEHRHWQDALIVKDENISEFVKAIRYSGNKNEAFKLFPY